MSTETSEKACNHIPSSVKHEFFTVDEQFSGLYHHVYRCSGCGKFIERGCVAKDGKAHLIWKLYEERIQENPVEPEQVSG